MRTGAWKKGAGLLGHDIRGKTIGIIGFGGIGRAVAATARGFDMKVIYFQRTRNVGAESSGLAAFRERDDLFREADIVSVHCGLTPETRRSIGERELNLMKPSSYFLNLSRGAVIDHAALVRALEAGRIAGAGLDVTTRSHSIQPIRCVLSRTSSSRRISGVAPSRHAGRCRSSL